MSIKDIIREFKNLDLKSYPEKEIRDLFNNVGPIGSVIVTFHKGKSVMRARPNGEFQRFSKKSDFSYKPQDFNNTYQRASTPYETMFYATSVPDKIEEGELDNMRIIGLTETIPMLRDKTKSGYEKISFGRWVVKEDINLMAIVHEESYFEKSYYTRELVNAYDQFIKQFPKDVIDKSVNFQNFLAGEFSKEEIRDDYDYMISAIFTQNVVNSGFGLDGVLYPSVRTAGDGFNIAITPEATKKLQLCVAGECSIYKNKDQVVVGNDAIVEVEANQENFKLIDEDVDPQLYLEKIGVKSIEELKASR